MISQTIILSNTNRLYNKIIYLLLKIADLGNALENLNKSKIC